MKTLAIYVAAALMAMISVVLSGNYTKAVAAGSEDVKSIEKMVEEPGLNANSPDVFENYASPALPTATCQGKQVGSDTRTFVFGYTRPDGFCATNAVVANSYNEAWICARAYCSTCQMEDITGMYQESPFTNRAGLTSRYCPAK